MQTLTNNSGLSLALAVWLAHDDYDNGSDAFAGQNLISATSLLKPTRQIVLAPRVNASNAVPVDVLDLFKSRRGTAFHDAIEQAWKKNYAGAMKRLGYPQRVIDSVRINPEKTFPGEFPVYLEQRHFREIIVDGMRVVISGKFDQIINGELNDTKATSVYTYIKRSKAEDYGIQGSIYKWIKPELITSDVMRVQHIFTDWQKHMTKSDPNYPPQELLEFQVELMGELETENWIKRKVREIVANQDLDEPDVIRCTDEELWKSDPVFKYYSDPAKAAAGGRSTKNFPNYPAAMAHLNKMKGKGTVITVPAQVKACLYCPAFPVCTQKDEYELDQ